MWDLGECIRGIPCGTERGFYRCGWEDFEIADKLPVCPVSPIFRFPRGVSEGKIQHSQIEVQEKAAVKKQAPALAMLGIAREF